MHDDGVYARLLVFHILSSHSVIGHAWDFVNVHHIQVRPEGFHEESPLFSVIVNEYYEVNITSRIADQAMNGYYDVLHGISHASNFDPDGSIKSHFSYFYWDFDVDYNIAIYPIDFQFDFNLLYNWTKSVNGGAFSGRHYFRGLSAEPISSGEKDPDEETDFDIEAKEGTGTSPITYDPDYALRVLASTFEEPAVYLDPLDMDDAYLLRGDIQYAPANFHPSSQFDSQNFAAQRNSLAYSSSKRYNGITNTGVNFLPNLDYDNVSRKDLFHYRMLLTNVTDLE